MLIEHEGIRLKPYRCPAGKLTIGIGRNLDDVGISKSEAYYLLDRDIARSVKEAQSFAWFWQLDEVRQDVVVAMVFNLGFEGFREFGKTIAALASRNFTLAATEMLDSDWARQVGQRARTLSKMMLTGQYPEETDA
jgi:lysozyme